MMLSMVTNQCEMVLIVLLIFVSSFVQAYVLNAVVEEDFGAKSITCWTCPNKTDNEECNGWAPDKFCPTNHTICQTSHKVDISTGRSIQVNKRCALSTECTADVIGCHDTSDPNIKDCISCCNFAYCNEKVPSNETAAVMLSSLVSPSFATRHLQSHWLYLVTAIISLWISAS